MQDRIEELEYIKNNIGCSPSSSLLSMETDENGMDQLSLDNRSSYDDIRRKSLLFLHEAQRLANERRVSLAQPPAVDETILKNTTNDSHLSDNEDHSTFSFDQRSDEEEEEDNTANLHEDPPG
jgi:hypothetical protein